MQVAAGRALHYAEQLRRKGRRATISLPSATTARDIQPTRPGETRPRTSHRDIASNNSRKLQQLGRSGRGRGGGKGTKAIWQRAARGPG